MSKGSCPPRQEIETGKTFGLLHSIIDGATTTYEEGELYRSPLNYSAPAVFQTSVALLYVDRQIL